MRTNIDESGGEPLAPPTATTETPGGPLAPEVPISKRTRRSARVFAQSNLGQHLNPLPSPTRVVPETVLHLMSFTISGLLGDPSDVCSLRQVCKVLRGALVQVVGRVESNSYMVRSLFGSGITVRNLDLVHNGAHWNFGETAIPLSMNLWQYEIESDNRGGLRPLLPSGEPVTQIQ